MYEMSKQYLSHFLFQFQIDAIHKWKCSNCVEIQEAACSSSDMRLDTNSVAANVTAQFVNMLELFGQRINFPNSHFVH